VECRHAGQHHEGADCDHEPDDRTRPIMRADMIWLVRLRQASLGEIGSTPPQPPAARCRATGRTGADNPRRLPRMIPGSSARHVRSGAAGLADSGDGGQRRQRWRWQREKHAGRHGRDGRAYAHRFPAQTGGSVVEGGPGWLPPEATQTGPTCSRP
jgi:hypothetical protein